MNVRGAGAEGGRRHARARAGAAIEAVDDRATNGREASAAVRRRGSMPGSVAATTIAATRTMRPFTIETSI